MAIHKGGFPWKGFTRPNIYLSAPFLSLGVDGDNKPGAPGDIIRMIHMNQNMWVEVGNKLMNDRMTQETYEDYLKMDLRYDPIGL